MATKGGKRRPLERLERDVLGCTFSGCRDKRIRPYHFRSELRGHIFAAHEVLRDADALEPIPPGDTADDIAWKILAAETDAGMVCREIVNAGWWHSFNQAWDEMKHCLGVYDCPLDYRPGIGQWDIDHFPHAVDQLIEQYELREAWRKHRTAQERIERRLLEVCA